jgi:antitoxin (DNA-binding transcriptional repressor) of toxin-antitoxin stability system
MTMSEAKPIASLSSVLLARKGAARPAMRRQVIGNGHGVAAAAAGHEDLGWNDMGYDVDPDPAAPMDYEHGFGVNPLAAAVPDVTPEVKAQQNRIAEQLNVQAEEAEMFDAEEPVAQVVPIAAPKAVATVAKAKAPRAAAGSKGKSAFTLRLDGDRHLRLRLACAVSNSSAQMLVTAALDAYIESMPEIGALAAQIPTKSNNQSR